MPIQPLDPLPRRFGKYSLFDRIGEGGMARIYLGREKTELGGERRVVVKQMLPMLSNSKKFSHALIEEAKLASRLSHGNIVQVFDLGRDENVLYIAMEYVEGFDLRQLLQRCSRDKVPLPIEFSLYIIAQVLRALDYAHRKTNEALAPLGIVHRDVSPSNVLLSFDGEVKLCDFGIAKAIGSGENLLKETIQGKAGYMSPEAAAGDAVDARSDVFAAGIILWELLSGRRLYRSGADLPPSLAQARAADIPPLPERGSPNEEKLFAVVMRALEKDTQARYGSARDMLRDLEEYIDSVGMLISPIRFGEWMTMRFGTDIIEVRRMRERAAKAIEAGPLLQLSLRQPGAASAAEANPEVQPAAPSAADGNTSDTRPPSLLRPNLRRELRATASAYLGMVVLVVLLAAWLLR